MTLVPRNLKVGGEEEEQKKFETSVTTRHSWSTDKYNLARVNQGIFLIGKVKLFAKFHRRINYFYIPRPGLY